MLTISIRFSFRAAAAAVLLTASLASPGAGARAQSAPPSSDPPAVDRSAWGSGWHVVRPGDTLEGLAERFLGSSQLWRELHALNPFVRDPDLLQPGQRLRIFLERPTPQPSAQVVATARTVNELPRPAAWRPAGEGDVLLEKDGLRTERAASARLLFDDGAALNLAADSLIFIRRQTRSSAPAPKKEIEIEVGQADVEGPPATAGSGRGGTIEIVVGEARSKSAMEAGKPLKARSRKSASNAAQFMVYEGTSTVAAAGKTVDVPAGSGTSVEPKAAPSPAEPLLPAPTGLEPGSGGEFDRSAPRLAWKPVGGAASYVVEVCRDAACGAIVEIGRGIGDIRFAPREPLDGPLFWRVTAVAASGLDGFPSPTQPMTAVESVAPPAPTLALYLKDGERLAADACAATVPELEVRAVDSAGKAAPWSLVVDGVETTAESFRALPLAGKHTVAARTTDSRGRSSDSAAARLTLDGAGPWIELGAAGAAPAAAEEGKKAKNGEETAPVCDASFELRDASGAWRPVPCSIGAAGEPLRVALAGERAALELRTAGASAGEAVLGGMPAAAGEALRLTVWDVGCGLAEASFRIGLSPYASGRLALVAEVADRAGNRRPFVWNFGR